MKRLFLAMALLVLAVSIPTSIITAQEPAGDDVQEQVMTNKVFLPLIVGRTSGDVTQNGEIDISSNFASLAQDLLKMESLFSGGNGDLVTFDSLTAQQLGFSEESIGLAEELAAHTNDLILAAREAQESAQAASIDSLSVETTDYPRLQSFFVAATEYSRSISENEVEAAGWCNAWLTDAACSCGHWWYPRPSRAAPWRNWTSSNPANTLRSWGYHETPGWAGGGWTRAQTYYSSRCGNNTFRDHAYTTGSTTFREQNYSGFTPRGEPNPEFWNGGPWPYAAWPSYVQWWHSNF